MEKILSVRTEASQYRQIEQMAERDGVTMSAFVRAVMADEARQRLRADDDLPTQKNAQGATNTSGV